MAAQVETAAPPPKVQLCVREQSGWRCVDEKMQPTTEYSQCWDNEEAVQAYSPNGKWLAVVNRPHIEIWDAETMKLSFKLDHEMVRNIVFSPGSRYMISYHFRKNREETFGNVIIWDLDERREVSREMLRQTETFDPKDPPVKWDFLSRVCFKISKKPSLLICRGDNPSKTLFARAWKKLTQISVSPYKQEVLFTAFTREKPPRIELFRFEYDQANPEDKEKHKIVRLAARVQMNAEEVEFVWNRRGDRVLCVTECAVDKSNQSYYGAKHLCLLDNNGLSWRVPISDKAPLQDAKWHPNGRHFCLVDGYPLRATMLSINEKEKPWQITTSACNTIRFSPQGNFLVLGGFGNLNGHMSFWDTEKRVCLGTGTDTAARTYEWSPNGRLFITARCFPARRVDNGFKIWRYNGDMLFDINLEKMYQASFRPAAFGVYKAAPPSPNVKPMDPRKIGSKSASGGKKKTAYVPPHLRKLGAGGSKASRVTAMLRSGGSNVNPELSGVQYSPEELARREEERKRKRDLKKAKKKEKQAERKRQEEEAARLAELEKQKGQQRKDVDLTDQEGVTKAIRREKKKLRQITSLKEKAAGGAEISEQQQAKLDTEPEVLERLKTFEAALAKLT